MNTTIKSFNSKSINTSSPLFVQTIKSLIKRSAHNISLFDCIMVEKIDHIFPISYVSDHFIMVRTNGTSSHEINGKYSDRNMHVEGGTFAINYYIGKHPNGCRKVVIQDVYYTRDCSLLDVCNEICRIIYGEHNNWSYEELYHNWSAENLKKYLKSNWSFYYIDDMGRICLKYKFNKKFDNEMMFSKDSDCLYGYFCYRIENLFSIINEVYSQEIEEYKKLFSSPTAGAEYILKHTNVFTYLPNRDWEWFEKPGVFIETTNVALKKLVKDEGIKKELLRRVRKNRHLPNNCVCGCGMFDHKWGETIENICFRCKKEYPL